MSMQSGCETDVSRASDSAAPSARRSKDSQGAFADAYEGFFALTTASPPPAETPAVTDGPLNFGMESVYDPWFSDLGIDQPTWSPEAGREQQQRNENQLRSDANPSQIADYFGVKFDQTPDGQYEFSLQLRGEKQAIASDGSPDGIRQSFDALRDYRDNIQASLESMYGVSFSGENEPADYIISGPDAGKIASSRPPKLNELLGIDAALSKSYPANLDLDTGRGMKFYFLKETTDPENPPHADYQTDMSGRESIYIHPRISEYPDITSQDTPSGTDPSIESLVLHELAHNTQHNVGDEDPAVFGWGFAGDTVFGLRGRDGYVYSPGAYDYPNEQQTWVRFDSSARSVDANGNPSLDPALTSIENSEMRDIALVHPMSEYFPTPIEMEAETLKYFRLGGKAREELLANDANMYAAVKDLDQRELNRVFGTDASGQPLVMRNTDGSLASATPENKIAIQLWEVNAYYAHLDQNQASTGGA